jgi:hypothetical protein
VRLNYKIVPLAKAHPAYPKETSVWMPMLSVQLSVGHGQKTPRFEAIVDSGSGDTLFHSDIGKHLKIDVPSGARAPIGGIVKGHTIDAFFHDVNLWVGIGMIHIKAGFSDQMTTGALLGRHGFFEHFTVTFDPANNPPGFEIIRLPKI